MEESQNLERLLEKLIQNKLNVEEINELSQYLTQKDIPETLYKYFLRIWDISHKSNLDIISEDLLYKINRKLGIENVTSSVTQSRFRGTTLFKYAAIFIIAFALAYLLFSPKGINKADRKLISGNSEVLVSYGSKSRIRLPDGSVVNLNSGSVLTYPAVFTENNRNVYLKGEGYFQVQADTSHPFYVHTSEITIKVTGTVFNVKSYAESNTVETTLISGILEISDKKSSGHNFLKDKETLLLKPNQKAIYVKDINRLGIDDRNELKLEYSSVNIPKLSMIDKVDTQFLTAWKDNKLIFNNERFEDLCIRLERWYDVKITLRSKDLRNERYTGTFENETIEQVLDAMKLAAPFNYNMEKNNIFIFRN